MRKNVLDALSLCGIVPVVVLEHAENAIPTARSLLAGGVDVMEITFRTAAAPDAIRAVSAECPDMMVGAGTVITLEQCKQAVDCGARFIVSPGFDQEIVGWCVAQGIAVTPGCVTPSEIMAAMKLGLNVLKFFPANVYGGLAAMKALAGPFGNIRFIPTGGVSTANLGEYVSAPFVHAVGGSWVCSKGDIDGGNFEKISRLCAEAHTAALGYEVAHIGLNSGSAEDSLSICRNLHRVFGLPIREGNSSNFVSGSIEVMKSMYRGQNGHIAIHTNSLPMAIADLERRGISCDQETAKYTAGRMTSVYLSPEFGGFAIHLLQK